MRPIAYWIEDGYEGLSEVCSRCGSPKPTNAGIAGQIAPGTIHFCYCCGSNMKKSSEMHKCGEYVNFEDCRQFVDECEEFREVGGCSYFEPKKRRKNNERHQGRFN